MIKRAEIDRDKALKIIYNQNKEMVCSYIIKNSGSYEEAKDVYQETIIAFYENVKNDKFKSESSIGTYLYSIAKFKWLNQLKKNGIMTSHHEKIETDVFSESPLTTIIDKENEHTVFEILSEVGEACKKLLIDTIYHNISMKEIVLQGTYSSEQIVRNKKYKCLKKLKKLIIAKPALMQILYRNE